MSALHNIEEKSSDKPILCIVGEDTTLVEKLTEDNVEKFKIILVSTRKFTPREDLQNLYSLTYEEAQVLPKLQEKIDYSIIFCDIKSSDFLLPILSKLKHDKAKSILISDVLDFEENLTLINSLKENSNFHFALMGEIIDGKKDEQGGVLSKFINKAKINGQVSLTTNSNLPIYPIFLNDATKNIYRLLFGSFKNTSLYFLFYKYPEALLSAMHILGRVSPEINIIFPSEETEASSVLTRKQIENLATDNAKMPHFYLDSDASSFEKGLYKFFYSKKEDESEKIIVPIVKSTEEKKRVKKKTAPSLNLNFFKKSFLGGVMLFIFLNLFFLLSTFILLRNAVKGIENSNFSYVYNDANSAKKLLNVLRPTAYTLLDAASVIDKKNQLKEAYYFAENMTDLARLAGKSVIDAKNPKTISDPQKIESLISDFTYLFSEGESISLRRNNDTLKSLIKPEYSKFLSMATILRPILGFDTEKNYLLLFQNNNEIRPTGGFIGSVGELTVKNGKFGDLIVRDVYDLDGQLKVHIEPPFVVRRYLQPHLYLRDSNFSLDYEEAVSKAALIYSLETGKKPNAVIAINLDVLKKILKITGPIKLEEYKTTFDENNISSFLQDKIQENNFPGSTAKKDLLNMVLSKMVLLISKDPKYTFEIAKLLPNLLEEKNILVAFQTESLQKLFRANGYSGKIEDARVKEKNNIYDFLYINEANIGVNKVNEFVTREIKYETVLSNDTLESNLKIVLNNKSKKDAYKAYLQIASPRGSKVKQIKINDELQEFVPAVTDSRIYEGKNFKAPKQLEVEQYTKGEHSFFAFIITSPIESESIIEIIYDNGAKVPLSNIFSYSLKYIKQPGTEPYKLTHALYHPDNYFVHDKNTDSLEKNYISEEKTVFKDFETNIEFKKSNPQ